MCRLLVFGYDKTSSDPDKDKKCPKKGMVLVAKRDDWVFSETEQSPPYKIIDLPNVPVDDPAIQALLRPAGTNLSDPDLAVFTQKRAIRLNLDLWTTADDEFVSTANKKRSLGRLADRTVDFITVATPS